MSLSRRTRRHVATLALSALAILTSACSNSDSSGDSSSPAAPTGPTSSTSSLQFSVPATLTASKGTAFTYSFCRPELTISGALCQGTNPSGGQPPYHFQIDSGGDFPPTGLTLGLNGILSGTPSVTGQKNVRLCAVDLAGANVCRTVSIMVNAPTVANLKFAYSCTTRTNPFRYMTCLGTADFDLNAAVPSGVVVVTMQYSTDPGDEKFRGTANVSTAAGGPGAVHIANFDLNNYVGTCRPTYETEFKIWGGVLSNNPPLLASIDVKGTTTCS